MCQSVLMFLLSCLVTSPGTSAITAINPNLAIVQGVNISFTDRSSDNMLPVCTQMKLYGIKPINTDRKNIWTGMLTIGDAMFRNQFGVMGKNLKNSRK